MNDLSAMLREAVRDAPPETVDPQALLAAGQRRVRHRRTAAACVSAAVLVIVAVAVTAIPRLQHSAPPVHPDRPRTVQLADVPEAPAGDLSILSRKAAPTGNTHAYLGMLPDGGAIELDGAGREDRFTVDGVKLPKGLSGSYLGLSNGRAVFEIDPRASTTGMSVNQTSELRVYDPRTRRLGPSVGHDSGLAAGVAAVLRGRLYASDGAANRDANPGARLVSTPLDGSLPPAWQKNQRVGLLASDGDSTLAYTDDDERPTRITLRNVTTGEGHSFDPRIGGGCAASALAASAKYVTLAVDCSQAADSQGDQVIDPDRVLVYTTNGRLVLTAKGKGAITNGTDSGAILITTEGRKAGVFALTDGGELLRLPGSFADSQASAVAGNDGTLVSWIRQTTSGKEYVVARLH